MLQNLTSGIVRNIQIEVQVTNPDATKVAEVLTVPVTVNVNDQTANAWMPLSADNQSSANITVNIATGQIGGGVNNISSLDAVKPMLDELTAKVKAVITELQTV